MIKPGNIYICQVCVATSIGVSFTKPCYQNLRQPHYGCNHVNNPKTTKCHPIKLPSCVGFIRYLYFCFATEITMMSKIGIQRTAPHCVCTYSIVILTHIVGSSTISVDQHRQTVTAASVCNLLSVLLWK